MAVHDISCVGKCSLTVALPIISAAGIECSALPTAVLSTHTGGFTGFTYRDLTEDIDPIANHWESLGLKFDCIYTGFLGSYEQIDLVCGLIDRFGKDSIIVVDPVMADEGKLYKVFDDDFPQGMKKLCSRADVIMPNITEACLMLGIPYSKGPYTPGFIEDLLRRLSALGPRMVILTGVYFDDRNIGAASFDAETGEISHCFAPMVPGYYHGTGDVFSSAAVAAIMCGKSVGEAIRIAVDFTQKSIVLTYEAGTDTRFGVNFEANLPWLVRRLGFRGV